MKTPMTPAVSIVASVFNEEHSLEAFHARICSVLEKSGFNWELIYVNDGSSDGSLEILRTFAVQSPKTRVVSFTKNFGHEAAMIAGIDHSSGDAVICLDSDLQHPPELIPEMVRTFVGGVDVVMMVRLANPDMSPLRRLANRCFYRVMNVISDGALAENASDFFLLSRRAAAFFSANFRERNRYLRSFIQLAGFKSAQISFEADQRHAGESSYSLTKLIRLSVNAICNISNAPLTLAIYAGLATAVLALGVGILSIVVWFLGAPPSGYSTLVVVITFFFAMQFFFTGLLGIYLAKLYTEVKSRPIYVVDSVTGLDDRQACGRVS